MQCWWFAVQCLARVFEHLPLSALEYGTVAYIFTIGYVYLITWDKPKDVCTPIAIRLRSYTKKHQGTKVIAAELEAREPDPVEKLAELCDGGYYTSDVGLHWDTMSWHVAGSFFVLYCAIFRVWHCFALDIYFPTDTERWLWRATAIVSATPAIFLLLAVRLARSDFRYAKQTPRALWSRGTATLNYLFGNIFAANLGCACGFLLLEMFIGFRRVPPGIFSIILSALVESFSTNSACSISSHTLPFLSIGLRDQQSPPTSAYNRFKEYTTVLLSGSLYCSSASNDSVDMNV
ncbi:hypothetical protein OBBRIDRAFT_808493 [Obba rivulosa]|uniref:Uncharacterized protein n=1 Tax=Obba rivulosa TaxID=1052685 RepID=A0A8E2AH63_9APHY|nr:hypothetical protein OBBRIDRAFT_808493 [Obba rivulosa]